MKIKKITSLVLLFTILSLILSGCGFYEESKLEEATLYFTSYLSAIDPNDSDKQLKVLEEKYKTAKKEYRSDIVYYDFAYYFFKFEIVAPFMDQGSAHFVLNTLATSNLNMFSPISDLKELTNTIKKSLGEYDRDFKDGEVSYLQGKAFMTNGDFKTAVSCFEYAYKYGYSDSKALLDYCKSMLTPSN